MLVINHQLVFMLVGCIWLCYSLPLNRKNEFPTLVELSDISKEDGNCDPTLSVPRIMGTTIKKTNFISIIRSQREEQVSLAIKYSLFEGISSLRNVIDDAEKGSEVLMLLECLDDDRTLSLGQTDRNSVSNVAVAILVLCRYMLSDPAHELVLGVNLQNYKEAEYVRTHVGEPGVEPWINQHPLSDEDDMLHSIIHRLCEGPLLGEGGYSGWENAEYWAAGGPKLLYDTTVKSTREHPVRIALCKAAMKYCPLSVRCGVVNGNTESTIHRIICGGGKYRNVAVPAGWWDPFTFISLIRENLMGPKEAEKISFELDWLQDLELRLLLRHELLRWAAKKEIRISSEDLLA